MDVEKLLELVDGLDPNYAILGEARQRYRAGQSVRGLRKPDGAPPDAWWSVQRRDRGGVYLYLRWRDFGRLRARSLGRLDNATA